MSENLHKVLYLSLKRSKMRNAYLFVWNPKFWKFEDLEEKLLEIKNLGITTMDWKVQSFKKIQLGDRAFVMRVGKNFRGIFASGIISRLPFQGSHFKDPTKKVFQVNIDFDNFLNPFTENNLALEEIESNITSDQFWTPHQSGIQIRNEVVYNLEMLWNDFIIKKGSGLTTTSIQSLFEGVPYEHVIKSYERSKYAKQLCLAEYGYECSVCEMNFEKTYGLDIGKNFIHVHHLNEMAMLNAGRYTDPVNDLRPVCPNCHAMLHKTKPAMSIIDLKARYNTRNLT